ncbi:MAG: ABC transporter ATP-binding protein/permease [Gemmatimonadetes bacterium]|nr:ABC transporter ATP-binding protein/permease [Gemmatimonadota bacterium]
MTSARAISWFQRTYPRRTAVLVGLLALAGVSEGLGLLTLLPLLQIAAGGEAAGGMAERAVVSVLGLVGARPTPGSLLGLILTALLAKGLFRWMAMRRVGDAVAQVARDLRLRLMGALMRARWSHVAGLRSGALASSISREVFWGANAYRNACSAAAAALQALAYAVVVVLVSWRVGALALVAAALLALALGVFVRLARRAGADLTERSRRLVSRLLDVAGGLKAIRAMGREAPSLAALERDTARVERAERRHVLAVESLHAFHEPLLALVLAPAAWWALTAGGIDLPTLLVSVFLFHRLVGRVHTVQSEYQAMVAAEAAFHAVRRQIEDAEAAREDDAGGPAVALERSIEVRGVSFFFGQRRVLDDVSLEIPAHHLTVLTGPSGVGKTTLLDLLVGLRRPDAGDVFVDGVPLAAMAPARWRVRLGYVPQEPVLLGDTVARNVTLRVEDVPDADVERALRRAGAWTFVSALPGGIHAELGERGGSLSGGERQRIAVARALLHRPTLLVLDEATSELDHEAEAALCDTLLRLRSEVTIVAASHRPALAAVADRVYALRDGRAVLVAARAPSRPALEVSAGEGA